MSSPHCKRLISRTLIAAAAVAALGASRPVFADPPDRVARISYINGPVSFRPANDDWDPAVPNYPLTIGDHLWADRNGRAELGLGSAAVRIGPQTDIGILNLDDGIVQVRITSGTVDVHLRDQWRDTFEVDTPNGAVSLLGPGTYRVDVRPDGDASTVTVRRGQASVIARGFSYPVRAQESVEIAGVDAPRTQLRDAIPVDEFEDWCVARDRREDTALSARYVPEDLVGYSDLDEYGTWSTVADYGPVWMPRVAGDWAPYRDGRWVWIDPWGWTWVDAEPWGFAPFHYGRWVSLRGRWGWVPGRFVERPVYAPALVAFVGGPGWGALFSFGSEPVGWFPLGPREPYVPAYRVSQRYIRSINTPHVNVRNVNITNITYVNRSIPGAVTAVPREAFVRSRPVRTSAIIVSREAARNGAIVGHGAPIGGQAYVRERDPRTRPAAPPASIQNRTVVVRRQPPAPAQGQPRQQQPQYAPRQPQTAPAARPTRPQPPSNAPQQEPPRARGQNGQPQQEAQPQAPPARGRVRTQDQPQRERQPQGNQQPQGQQPQRSQQPQGDQQRPPERRARPQEQPRQNQPRESTPRQNQPRENTPSQDQQPPARDSQGGGNRSQGDNHPQRPTSRRPPR